MSIWPPTGAWRALLAHLGLVLAPLTSVASGAVPPWALPIENFRVELPGEVRAFPEEPGGGGVRGFKLRGTKGWKWSAPQYLEEIPRLKQVKMNFLMNCYLSFFDETTGRNQWWKPFTAERQEAYAKVISSCAQSGITFCFAMHPHLGSDRPMRLDSEEDFEAFFAHFAWAQGLGVRFFSISMDDVDQVNSGPAHARFCNRFLKRLREKDAEAQLVFCPTSYTTASAGAHPEYLRALSREMDKDVYVFWTGPTVVPATITRADAEEFKALAGHRLILWDNYPVNDGQPTLHLGPITGRDPELAEVCDGYMANPMSPQNQIGRLPLFTMADYAYNPRSYDPMRSIGQAVIHLADTMDQRRVLADLVEVYPGDLICGKADQPGFNPVRDRYRQLTDRPGSRYPASSYIASVEQLLARVRRDFREQYHDAQATLKADIDFLRADFNQRYGGGKPSPGD